MLVSPAAKKIRSVSVPAPPLTTSATPSVLAVAVLSAVKVSLFAVPDKLSTPVVSEKYLPNKLLTELKKIFIVSTNDELTTFFVV